MKRGLFVGAPERQSFWITLIVSFGLTSSLWSEVRLPPIFSDHMVLQRAAAVPLWGTAAPGEAITVVLDKTTVRTHAGADGKWQAVFDLSQASSGPLEATVQGTNRVTIQDVVVGEVWLASGQSNMTMALKETAGAEQEIAGSTNPRLRSFLVQAPDARPTSEPQVDTAVEGKWIVAGPETSGSFTALGYYFGKKLEKELHVPVGIIHASVGGSGIESWLSLDSFDRDPELKEIKDRMLSETSTYPGRLQDFRAKYHAWEKRWQRQDRATEPLAFAAPETPLDGWKTAHLSGDLASKGLPDAGAVWFRATLQVPPEGQHTYVPVVLENARDFDAVYWNGTKIGQTTPDGTTSINPSGKSTNSRRYDAPGTLVHAGENTLAIRLFSPAGKAGFGGPIRALSSITFRPLTQSGEWMARTEFALPALDASAVGEYPTFPLQPPLAKRLPGRLYEAMIKPLVPYKIRGIIWDQGEANEGFAFQYRTSFRLLIEGWRSAWGAGDLPFDFVQLQNGGDKSHFPGDSAAAELREAQAMALSLPNTGMAVTIDLGEEATAHYRDKRTAGERLALPALATTYGRAVPPTGPVYQSMQVEGRSLRLRFRDRGGGLVAQPLAETYQPNSSLPDTTPLTRNSPDSQLEGFAICGPDHHWVWANAEIDGDAVVVSSPAVAQPVAVRYGWADNPTCNLYDRAGLPAAPFRTDDFAPVTLNARFGK